jgi:glutamate---cysteine ligase / carboxylate-amine ligase
MPAGAAVRSLLDGLRESLEAIGDWDEVSELVETTLARGNSADRQGAAFDERGELEDVMRLVVAETHGSAGGPEPAAPALPRYRIRAGDEAIARSGVPLPAYQGIVEHFRGLAPEALAAREAERDAWTERRALDFGVGAERRPFAVDLVPRVLNAHEWRELEAGLVQRARAIELFLRDVYGEQCILRDGVLPRSAVEGAPGWREEGTRLPAGVVRAPVMGFDIVRNEYGGWRVLEDNVRNPSGTAYAIAVRRLLDEVLPDLPRPPGVANPATAYEQLRRTLLAHAEPGTQAALLSSGPGSSAWF